jgi:hypothetical protein
MKVQIAGSAAVFLFVGSVLAAAPSPAGASGLVPMKLQVADTEGNPLPDVTFSVSSTVGAATEDQSFHTDAKGVGHFDALAGSTAVVDMSDGIHGYHDSPDLSAVRVTAGLLVDSADPGTPYRLMVPVGSTGTTTSLTLPTLVTRRFRVVTRAGHPVAHVGISTANLSVAVTEPQGDAARVVSAENIIATTNSAGWADLTTYQNETDPDALEIFHIEPGAIGARYSYSPTLRTRVDQGLTYSSYAAKTHVRIVVPFAPELVHTTAHRGRTHGRTIVSTTLKQRSAAGLVPVAGTRVLLYRQARPTRREFLLGAAKTGVHGKVTFHVRLAHRARLVLGIMRSHVPGVVIARPR